MELYNELIITEVEKYPVLYNPENEEYKNRNAKFEAWKKITEAIVGDLYQTLDEGQRSDIGKEVQKRWKTLKDTYLRSIKMQNLLTGSGASKRKPYIYHHQMSFLLPTIQYLRTSGSWEESTIQQTDDATQVPEENPPPMVKSEVPCVKKRKETFESELINLLKENQPSRSTMPPEDDSDRLFLLSLVPKVKMLNSSASFDFRIKVMQLLQGYLSDENKLLNHPPCFKSTSNALCD